MVDSRQRTNLPIIELGTSPDFRVGWEPGGLAFERVAHGAFLEDGRIVVVDAGGPTLYLFDPSGELGATVARRGGGPGELQSAGRPVPLSDSSFVITDAFNQRVSHFVGASFSGSDFLDPLTSDALYEVIEVLGADDYVLAPATFVESAMYGTSRAWKAFPVFRGPTDIERRQQIGSFDLLLSYTADDWNPVRPRAAVVAGQGGLIHTKSSAPEARWYGWDGALKQIARWSSGARDLGGEDWSEYEAAAIARAGDNSDSPRFRLDLQKRRDAFSGPTPEFGQVVVSEVGDLFLGRYEVTGIETDTYLMVNAEGEATHTVAFPRANRLLAASSSHALVVEVDELGVHAVAAYSIPPRSPTLR